MRTRNSPSDPWGTWIVSHIFITDNTSADDQNLSITITPITNPISDDYGIVNITFRTPEGKYNLEWVILDPLDIQPEPTYIVAAGFQVDNGSIQYNNRSVKLATVYARNEMYYVASEELSS